MQILKKITYFLLWYIGFIWSNIYSYALSTNTNKIKTKLYSSWISKEFKNFGKDSIAKPHIYLFGGKYISIGNASYIGLRVTLTAWDKSGTDPFYPEIIIGNNVSIGDDSHITAINRIVIGNNVLTGKKITITDNSHGKSNLELLSLAPLNRPLYSDGPVIIEDGVWIGDKVTILPNVRIGKNSIIGANAVVTKDIPANCVAGGIPAKVIKRIE
jgi:carbonic anhydrase/acetyltransferase-like protein (isoleucine patch superfamily)